MRLYGGFCDKADVDPIAFPENHLKKLILKDMPSVGLPNLLPNLPELTEFTIHNVEDFTKENFTTIFTKFLTQNTPMERIWLESLTFEIQEVEELLFNVIKRHHSSLRHISLARNKFSNEFLHKLCEQLAAQGSNVVETFNLMYLKDTNDTNWVKIL